MNQLDMKGRHAVITGGAAGLGFAIAQRMLAPGATVTLWDVYTQSWERTGRPTAAQLAALSPAEREQVQKHVG